MRFHNHLKSAGRKLPYKLRILFTLILITLPLSFATTAILSYIGTKTVDDFFTSELSNSVRVVGSNSSAAILFNDKKVAKDNLKTISQNDSFIIACLYNKEGKLFVSSKGTHSDAKTKCPVDTNLQNISEDNTISISHPITENSKLVGSIYALTNKENANEYKFEMLMKNFLTFFLVSLILLLPLIWVAQRFLSSPIRNLLSSTKSLTNEMQSLAIIEGESNKDEMMYIKDVITLLAKECINNRYQLEKAIYKNKLLEENTKFSHRFLGSELEEVEKDNLIMLKIHDAEEDNLDDIQRKLLLDSYERSEKLAHFVKNLENVFLEVSDKYEKDIINLSTNIYDHLVKFSSNIECAEIRDLSEKRTYFITADPKLLDKSLTCILDLMSKILHNNGHFNLYYEFEEVKNEKLVISLIFSGIAQKNVESLVDLKYFEYRELLFMASTYAKQNGHHFKLDINKDGFIYIIEIDWEDVLQL